MKRQREFRSPMYNMKQPSFGAKDKIGCQERSYGDIHKLGVAKKLVRVVLLILNKNSMQLIHQSADRPTHPLRREVSRDT